MRLCNTIPARLLAKNKCKQYNTLNINDFKKKGATDKPRNLFTYNLVRYHTRASEDVSCGQKPNDSKFHVKNVSSHNGFGG